ncbi:hypothetical protein LEMLEM_LOCUS17921 [Lemmus lemmus]
MYTDCEKPTNILPGRYCLISQHGELIQWPKRNRGGCSSEKALEGSVPESSGPCVLVLQDPDNADQTSDAISTQTNDVISTQTNDAISTQTNDVANQGIEVNTQVPGTYRQGLGIQTQLPDVSNHGSPSPELDRQNVLDGAEALLLLHNSPQTWQETSSTPGSWLLVRGTGAG